MQSPICVNQDSSIIKHFPPFHFTGYNQSYNAQITYTEQAINIELWPQSILPSVSGGGLVKEYILIGIDFHWESEHVINEKRYPLEAQFIHYAKKYENFANALNYKDGIAIFSTFFDLSQDSSDTMEKLIESIPFNEHKIDHPIQLQTLVTPRNFLPPKISKFYRYNGSLTKPCFDETVIWTLFSIPCHLSQAELEEFCEIWNDLFKTKTNNCRDLQENYDRRVYLSAL